MKVGDLVRRHQEVWPHNQNVGIIIDVLQPDDAHPVYFLVHDPDEEEGWYEQKELIPMVE